MSDGGAVADVETIRAALTCFWRGSEGTHSFCLPDDRREPALTALDALVSERERLQRGWDIALEDAHRIAHERDEAEAERDRLAAALQRAKNLRPFKPKALADQYLVCINEGDWNLFAEALARVVSPQGERTQE